MPFATPSSTSFATRPMNNRGVRRLGPHHFAHLRAVAEGLDLTESARRYLGVEHGHEAVTAHRQAVDAVRAVARRQGDAAWRLVGLTLRAPAAGAPRPALAEFIAAHGLDGFSESEALECYEASFPADRKAARSQRLRARQLELLRRLEGLAAETPQPSDLVTGWFEEALAAKLVTAGLLTLGALNARISTGGRWFAALPAVGVAKAQRIERHLATLLPREVLPGRPRFVLNATPALFGAPVALGPASRAAHSARTIGDAGDTGTGVWSDGALDDKGDRLPAARALPYSSLSPSPSLLGAASDLEAVQGWIRARAGSQATARVYQREAHRLLLWLQYEGPDCPESAQGGGRALAQMQVADCTAFMAFLQHIPPRWISRVRAAPGEPGWAPFRGPLSHASRRQAVVIIASMFSWLQAAQYLPGNPWLLVNQATGDDRNQKMLDSKALSEAAMREVLRYLETQAPSASRARMRFILRFVEAVGLRSAELLSATLADLRMEPEGWNGWVLQVHGKGARNRIAAVPGQALHALQDYLAERGLGAIQTAPPAAPLLASTLDP